MDTAPQYLVLYESTWESLAERVQLSDTERLRSILRAPLALPTWVEYTHATLLPPKTPVVPTMQPSSDRHEGHTRRRCRPSPALGLFMARVPGLNYPQLLDGPTASSARFVGHLFCSPPCVADACARVPRMLHLKLDD